MHMPTQHRLPTGTPHHPVHQRPHLHLRRQLPRSLVGGQQQRVVISGPRRLVLRHPAYEAGQRVCPALLLLRAQPQDVVIKAWVVARGVDLLLRCAPAGYGEGWRWRMRVKKVLALLAWWGQSH
jgi:hypothetical protein